MSPIKSKNVFNKLILIKIRENIQIPSQLNADDFKISSIFGICMTKMKCFIGLFLLMGFFANAQTDSIYIHATLENDLKTLRIHQKMRYTNPFDKPISEIKLLNWISAYQKTGTPLAKRKLEDRKKDLYFSKTKDLGHLVNLELNSSPFQGDLKNENLLIPLNHQLEPGKSTQLDLTYSLVLPKSTFTGYGSDEAKVLLKYFFLIPDQFEKDYPENQHYLDIEEKPSGSRFWSIDFTLPEMYSSESNLPKTTSTHFEGQLYTEPIFHISLIENDRILTEIDGKTIPIHFGYPLSPAEKTNLEFYLPLQLKFIKKQVGTLPEKLFISKKFKDKNDFFGNDDIKFWKFKFPMFTEGEKVDLDYFSIISAAAIDASFANYKKEQHWIQNGIKTFLEKEYLETFYKDRKLLGDLTENVKVLGIRPLKVSHASKLNLLDRYGITYQYIASQNFDQKIGEDFPTLSNFNEMAISQFETGLLFSNISHELGENRFQNFLTSFIGEHKNGFTNEEFLNQLSIISNQKSSYLEPIINKRNHLNFKLKNFKNLPNGNLQLKVTRNTPHAIPFRIKTESENGTQEYWFDTKQNEKHTLVEIPDNDVKKIIVNDDYSFPEKKLGDNYLYSSGLFSNMKKLKFKLFQDIPNPEYTEIYINPRFTFNAYDKVLLGLNFRNKSLFDQDFVYSATPYFSTGTGKMMGSASVAYSYRPLNSFFRSLTFGAAGSTFHYNYNLGYRKLSLLGSMNFTKDPRSTINRNLSISYNFFDKDLSPEMILNKDYDRYNLFSIGYGYSENRMIHEFAFGGNLQFMEDFQKLSAEASYRFEYARDKKIAFRVFGGAFINNKTRNDLFDFGISRISNYAFSYGLLGQSATDGILAQQFILAEGGFKSDVGKSANQWIFSTNVDAHVWKWFNLYGDAGVYKSKQQNPQFIWDSGVKLKVIPDFLEIYFPIQSSLGFEPSFKDYGKRIRYTLVFDLGAVTSYFRRGWF